ncbi:ABC transporter substrate-binding protein [bacterium]|nr:ABC transporter substrate-binding protein [bacterium]MBR2274029.1 ABC transporter substrate-binding protein [Alphaproteobacteria bacterium]
MKKIYLFLLALVCFAQIAVADIDKSQAMKMVENVTKEGIEQIINSNASIEEKNKIFRQLFTQNLDLDFIGKYVLGRYWRTATPAQQKEFIELYKELNVQTWSKRFDEFKGRQFVFEGTSPANNPNQIFVDTNVPMKEGAPAVVKWRVNNVNGKLKIIDIIIENVSLAQTARNEYTSFIAKSPKGVEGLLENLRTKVK